MAITPRRADQVRGIVLAVAFLGLLVNFGFDLLAFRGARTSKVLGDRVERSYDILLGAEKIDHVIEGLQSKDDWRAKAPALLVALEDLRQRVGTDTANGARLNKIAIFLRTPEPSAWVKADSELDQFVVDETARLSGHLDRDLREDQELAETLTHASILDTGILFLILALVTLDWALRRRADRNLRNSIEALRIANDFLENDRIQRQIHHQTIVHDLKNPLGAIHGFAELLKLDAGRPRSITEHSDTILRISETTLKLVESMLADRRDLSPAEPFDAVAALQNVCEQAEGQAHQKNQKLILDVDDSFVTILGDRLQFEEMLFNLIGNAIKYSPTGSRIWIAARPEDGGWAMTIEDEGPGFTASDKEKAFQYGQTLTAQPTAGESSSGIGLFMVRRTVELHKGQIRLEDGKRGRGARIELLLPAHSMKEAADPGPTASH